MFFFLFAWRNIYRNRRRSSLLLFVIALSVFCAVLIQAQQKGTLRQLQSTTLEHYTGNIQIRVAQTNKNIFFDTKSAYQKLRKLKSIRRIVPRLETITWAKTSKGLHPIQAIGIDPKAEEAVLRLSEQLTAGYYFSTKSEKSALLTVEFARKHSLRIGDTLYLQNNSQSTQYFIVSGICKIPFVTISEKVVFIPLQALQDWLHLPEKASSLLLTTPPSINSSELKPILQALFAPVAWNILTEQDLLPDVFEMLAVYTVVGYLLTGILYLLVALGIVSMVQISLQERRIEFQNLVKIGMLPSQLGAVLAWEILLLTSLGIVIGLVLVVPTLSYLACHPIVLRGEIAQSLTEIGLSPSLTFLLDGSVFGLPLALMGGVGGLIAGYYGITNVTLSA
jgi:ABC-type lipoprotein release transport system permease subunit